VGREEPIADLVVIVGPTASGKSALAMQLAEKFGGEIVNADSMQVYSGMDIGTAKPSPEERHRIRHHLLDIVTPDVNFTASDFRREASRAIEQIRRRGKRVILVGGTGLYLKALLQGLIDSPVGDDRIRNELRERALTMGNDGLLRMLAEHDPDMAARLHPNDQVRIIRALEVYLQTGIPVSRLRSEHGFAAASYRTLTIGLRVERSQLYERIDQRVDRMMAAGLVEEVRSLLARGFTPQLKAMRAIGYKEICAFMGGEYPIEEAVRLIKRNTRHYAKRQLTWFQRDPEIIWVEYPDNFVTISKCLIEFFEEGVGHGKSTV
jgi:tRNA dimethylallyltransferase